MFKNLKIGEQSGSSDGIVLKYSGLGMVNLLEQLFSVVWPEEIVPRQRRDGFINPWHACAQRGLM